jgi:hypothetical protein
LRAALHTWELDGFGHVTELLCDELVSNVVRHVGSPMTVRALRQPSSIRVEVDDDSADLPVLQHPDMLDDHGRGILLVASLADQWGSEPRATGKTVWFEIDVTTATEEVHGRADQAQKDLPQEVNEDGNKGLIDKIGIDDSLLDKLPGGLGDKTLKDILSMRAASVVTHDMPEARGSRRGMSEGGSPVAHLHHNQDGNILIMVLVVLAIIALTIWIGQQVFA